MNINTVEPYVQGNLDGLCGLYSVVNAVKLIRRKTPAKAIFKESLRFLSENHNLAEIVGAGMERPILSKLLNLAAKRVPVSSKWPFYRGKSPSLASFWSVLEGHVNEQEGRTAIVAFSCASWSHWSVVREVKEERLVLFDSDGRKQLVRSLCTTNQPTKARPMMIEAATVCLLSVAG